MRAECTRAGRPCAADAGVLTVHPATGTSIPGDLGDELGLGGAEDRRELGTAFNLVAVSDGVEPPRRRRHVLVEAPVAPCELVPFCGQEEGARMCEKRCMQPRFVSTVSTRAGTAQGRRWQRRPYAWPGRVGVRVRPGRVACAGVARLPLGPRLLPTRRKAACQPAGASARAPPARIVPSAPCARAAATAVVTSSTEPSMADGACIVLGARCERRRRTCGERSCSAAGVFVARALTAHAEAAFTLLHR